MSEESTLAEKFGISNFASIDLKKKHEILDKVMADAATKTEYVELLTLIPDLAKVTVKYFEAMIAVTRVAGSSQKSVADILQKSIDVLKSLIDHVESTDRIRLGEMVFEIAKMAREMNTENNNFWTTTIVGGGVFVVATLTLVGVLTGKINIGDAGKIIGHKLA